MPCPTCDHTMEGCGYGIFHCPRCGTLKKDDSIYVPALVERCRRFVADGGPAIRSATRHLGIVESVFLPEARPVR